MGGFGHLNGVERREARKHGNRFLYLDSVWLWLAPGSSSGGGFFCAWAGGTALFISLSFLRLFLYSISLYFILALCFSSIFLLLFLFLKKRKGTAHERAEASHERLADPPGGIPGAGAQGSSERRKFRGGGSP